MIGRVARRLQSLSFDFGFYLFIYVCLGWLALHREDEALSATTVGLMVTTAAVLAGLTALGTRRIGLTLGKFLVGEKESPDDLEKLTLWQRPWLWSCVLFLIVTVIVGVRLTEVDLTQFLGQGTQGAWRIFSALLHPNMTIFERCFYAMIQTVFMAFLATFFAVPLAYVLSFLAAHNVMETPWLRVICYATRFVMNFMRSVEPVVWAIVFSVWVGIGAFAGMLALWVHSVVSLAKNYYEQIETIDGGPVEALQSVGANRLQTVAYGVVPQVTLPFISFTIFRWDINVRMATVVGIVGGGGIGDLIFQYQGRASWSEVGLIIMMIAFVVWLMDSLSMSLRKHVA